jgi:RNA polymerase subunit RPABC4/transcription elongation factor Spt4
MTFQAVCRKCKRVILRDKGPGFCPYCGAYYS